jgi:hypothetical protein
MDIVDMENRLGPKHPERYAAKVFACLRERQKRVPAMPGKFWELIDDA